MNEMQVFTNSEFGQIRAFEIDGEPWCVGKDVARALGYGEGNPLLTQLQNTLMKKTRGSPN